MLTLADFRAAPLFAETVQCIRALGGDHEMFGFDFVGGYALQQNPEELAALLLLLKRLAPFDTYLEIGSASGGTARVLWQELGFRRALLIDDGAHPRAGELADNVRFDGVTVHRGDSHDPACWPIVADWAGDRMNIVAMIDGDHSFAGARLDLALIEDTCREGTVVIMHDIVACPGVQAAWEECAHLSPTAHLVADDRPLGIGVGRLW